MALRVNHDEYLHHYIYIVMKVTVYCASSSMIDEVYFEATRALAKQLVGMGAQVVFGGGANGLMGCLADAVLEEGGHIKGIIPEFMKEVEWGHPKVDDMEVVDTMAQRKHKLLEGADLLIALPGGTGTFEELLEALTLKRLGRFLSPIIIMNINGYYDALKTLLDKAIEEKFMAPQHGDMYRFLDKPEAVTEMLETFPTWSEDVLSFATLTKPKS